MTHVCHLIAGQTDISGQVRASKNAANIEP
jgi:hypothetical protein